LRRAEGGAKIFGVFRVKNHDFTPKNHIFSNCGGRCENVWGISCEKSRFYPQKIIFFPIVTYNLAHTGNYSTLYFLCMCQVRLSGLHAVLVSFVTLEGAILWCSLLWCSVLLTLPVVFFWYYVIIYVWNNSSFLDIFGWNLSDVIAPSLTIFSYLFFFILSCQLLFFSNPFKIQSM
jgi:hypothetical protein